MTQTIRFELDLSSGSQVVDVSSSSILSATIQDFILHATPVAGVNIQCDWSANGKQFFKFKPFRLYADENQNLYEMRASGNIRFLKFVSSTYADSLRLYLRCEEELDSRTDPREYDGMQAKTVQSYTEANSKAGVQYEAAYEFRAAAAGVPVYLAYQTGDKNVIVKSRSLQTNNVDTLLEVFEDCEFTHGSIPVKCYNLSREVGDHSTITVSANPTNLTVGPALTPAVPIYGSVGVGNRSSGGFGIQGLERVLKKNTKYLIRITPREGVANLWFYATWYEGPLSIDL